MSLQSLRDADHSIPPLPNVSLCPLLGAPPYAMQDLYSFYAAQIAIYVTQCSHLSDGYRPSVAEHVPKPLVIALALEPLSTVEEDLDTTQERQRLDKIISIIESCKVW